MPFDWAAKRGGDANSYHEPGMQVLIRITPDAPIVGVAPRWNGSAHLMQGGKAEVLQAQHLHHFGFVMLDQDDEGIQPLP